MTKICLVLVIILALVSAGIASEKSGQISTAKSLFVSGEYLSAIKELKNILAEKDISKENKYDAHFYLGLCYLIIEDSPVIAQEEFYKAIEIIPEKEMDTEMFSKKVAKIFNQARKEFELAKLKEEERIKEKENAERLAAEKELADQMRQEQERLAKIKREEEEKKLAEERAIYQSLKPSLALESRGVINRRVEFSEDKLTGNIRADYLLANLGLERKDLWGLSFFGGQARLNTNNRWSKQSTAYGLGFYYNLISPEPPVSPWFIKFKTGALQFKIPEDGNNVKRKINWLEADAALLFGGRDKFSFYGGPVYEFVQGEGIRLTGNGKFQAKQPFGVLLGFSIIEKKWFNLRTEAKIFETLSAVSFSVEM